MVVRKYKNLLAVVITIALAAAAGTFYFASPARSQQGTYFSDEFNMGAYNWTSEGGRWAIFDGAFAETTKPDTEVNWATAGSLSWTDYAVQAEVYSADTAGKFFLAGRWQDENNHYGLEYSSDENGAAGADTAKFILYSKKNGIRYNLLEINRSDNKKVPYIGEGAATVPNNPYPATIKLKFKGSNIEVYSNNELIGFTADTSVTYGKIALGEFNRLVYFDNIFVWDVTPPTIFDLAAGEIAGTAATITFSTSESTSYRIDYGLTDSYGSYKVKTARDYKHSVDLSGLSLNTQYHYKVTVTDAAGNRTVSADQTFTTASSLDLVAPTVYADSISVGDITADSATIYWTTGEPANSIVEYGTEPGVYKWSLSYDARTTDHAVYLKKLENLTRYYFRVKSRDLSGNLGVSGEYYFDTLNDLKPKITAIKTGSDPVSLTVSWQDVPEAVSYKVYVATSNNWGEPVATIFDTAGTTTYSHTEAPLTAYTNYFVRIYALDSDGDMGYATARVFPPSLNPHGNPHGFYKNNPELCGNCHYTHSALGPRLISEVNADRLCVTCHDGTQSKYDVVSGRFIGPTTDTSRDANGDWNDVDRVTWYESIAGPYGTVGGVTVANSAYSPTSRHDLNIFNYAAPGNNIENVETADSNLSCSSCHDPHGSDNYRNLRTNMKVLNTNNPPLINVEAYAVTDPVNKRENTIYVSGSVEFCGACHSDFNQSDGASRNAIRTTEQPGMTLSNASMHMYMHPVNVRAEYITKTGYTVPTPDYLPLENGKIICQTCHFTHGTTKTGVHYRRDGFYSTCLKRFDRNDGCEDCHDKTEHPD